MGPNVQNSSITKGSSNDFYALKANDNLQLLK